MIISRCFDCGESLVASSVATEWSNFCPVCGSTDVEHQATLINLTPHQVDIKDMAGYTISIPASGQLARCTQTEIQKATIGGLIRVTEQSFGEVIGLPEPRPDTWLIVSRLVKSAVPHRGDVVCPGTGIRDADGKIIGCQGVSL
jgi:hypothetical protein